MTQPWERGDERERWAGYLDPETGNPQDRRTWVLRNNVGARTWGQLQHLEGQFAALRAITARSAGVPATFDLDGLRAVHRHLFQDVYPWAGQIRTVNIAKGGGYFTAPEQIEPVMSQLAGLIAQHDNLRGIAPTRVPAALARIYGEINNLHPFREGNGRTGREFVAALARESGHRIDWDLVAQHSTELNENDVASAAYRDGDHVPMEAMFARIVHKDDVVAAAADDALALINQDRARSALAATYPSIPSRTAPPGPSAARAQHPPAAEAQRGYSR